MTGYMGSRIKLHRFATRDDMGAAAGAEIEELIANLATSQDTIRMVFAAAPSQEELLAYLVSSSLIDWPRIEAFHMDEYVGLDDERLRFSRFLSDRLFDRLQMKAVHLIKGNSEPTSECQRYAKLIHQAPIDIVCLGIGENGHLAFNDPHVADFQDPLTVKIVELDRICRQQQVNDGCFNSIDEVPTRAITLTIPTLLSGRHLFCVAPGATKRRAVANALTGPVSTSCPASVLRRHIDCRMYVDHDSCPVKW